MAEILTIIVLFLYAAFVAYQIGRAVEKERAWPKIVEARNEAAKYRALYQLAGGKL